MEVISDIILVSKCICPGLEPNRRNIKIYTRQGSNRLLGFQGCHRNASGEDMAAQLNKKSDAETAKSQLSKEDIRLILVMCTELVTLCARLTRRIDPAATAMLTYVRDDIVAENKNELR
jgi:methylphosphotriester-DNA--protein-cysteine methyltransferase